MRITLLWPFGTYPPGQVVDVDERIADVLIREAFARLPGDATPVERSEPTVTDLQSYAARHGCSLIEARDAFAAGSAAPLSTTNNRTSEV